MRSQCQWFTSPMRRPLTNPPKARVRHINAYGLKFPRLDRFQGLSEYIIDQSHTSLLLAIAELVVFNKSRRVFKALTGLWNGRVVYQRHWHSFLLQFQGEWLRLGYLVSAILFGCEL